MSKILYLYSFLIFISCSTKNHEITYHDNGSIKYDVVYKDSKLDGFTKTFDENGNLINKSCYVNNLLHGQWIDYYQNGNIQHLINYNYNFKDGKEIWYYESGNIKSQLIYKEDKIISDIIRWNQEGKIIDE
jgi:antitoxin component YwqK of YwqJK toxin-antitoxin module